MPDPLSLIAIGAAVGGGAGKFVEKAWDSGEKWIVSYFSGHQKKAREKAEENSTDFLKKLGERISELEKAKEVSEETITTSQEHPDFSVILQKAMLSAAQTDNENKHDLLARLVSERLKASPESMLAMASKMACEAISYTTPNHLQIIGLLTNVLYIQPVGTVTPEQNQQWLFARTTPFLTVKPEVIDYTHLESLSCMKFESFITRDLKEILNRKFDGNFNYEAFIQSPQGTRLMEIWEGKSLKSCQLTTVGQILGVMISDQVVGGKTNMSSWGV